MFLERCLALRRGLPVVSEARAYRLESLKALACHGWQAFSSHAGKPGESTFLSTVPLHLPGAGVQGTLEGYHAPASTDTALQSSLQHIRYLQAASEGHLLAWQSLQRWQAHHVQGTLHCANDLAAK